jgi:septal ring factor EnvC (AmiA/AmiB activator)
MTNPTIETDLAEILKEIKTDQKKLLEEINNVKLSQSKIEGKIDALDIKIDQLDKRVANQEFLNRGIFGGITLIVLGGAAKLFGWISNP